MHYNHKFHGVCCFSGLKLSLTPSRHVGPRYIGKATNSTAQGGGGSFKNRTPAKYTIHSAHHKSMDLAKDLPTVRNGFLNLKVEGRLRLWFFVFALNPKYLPETNIAPKNRSFQKESSIPTIHFQGPC